VELPASAVLIHPDRHWRQAMLAVLRQMGLLVLSFARGRDCLESLRTVGLIPDAIGFDDNTEDMSAAEFSVALSEALGGLAPPVMYIVDEGAAIAMQPSFRPGRDMVFPRPARARDVIMGILSGIHISVEEGRLLHAGGLELDGTSRTLKYGGRNVHLTSLEFGFMEYIMRRRGRLVTNDELLDNVWRFQPGTGSREVIRAHVRNVRRKLEFLGAPPDILRVLPRRGYEVVESAVSPNPTSAAQASPQST
jgi:two-component system copper resistance phosphate regulon response regulator CusR